MRETKWYYQIQGELATTGLLIADLINYTNKGIMIVEVEFNRDFWEAMLKRLTTFHKDYLVPELLTQKYTSNCNEFILCMHLHVLNFSLLVMK